MNRVADSSGFETIRVVVVGPDRLARASIEQSLSTMDGLLVVGVTSLDDGLHSSLEAFQPEVIVVEVDWDASTSDQGRQQLSELSAPLLLLLDPHLDLRGLGEGWLARGSSPAQIRAAVQAISQGLRVFDKEIIESVDLGLPEQADDIADPLTPRELEVVQWMAKGLTNRAIGFQLGISEYTVKFHVNAILTKLDAQSRTEASMKAARLGLIMF